MQSNLEKELEKALNNLESVKMSNKLKAQVLVSLIKSTLLGETSYITVRDHDSTKTSQ